MGGTVRYTMTMTIHTHTLHDHVDRCMKTEDAACQIMKNDQSRSTREWLCTSKADPPLETVARSWDDTLGNIWYSLSACDQILNIQSWKNGDPHPINRGISYRMLPQQDTNESSEDVSRISWARQPEPAVHHDLIYRRINGNSSGRGKRSSEDTVYPSERVTEPPGTGESTVQLLLAFATSTIEQCLKLVDHKRAVERTYWTLSPELSQSMTKHRASPTVSVRTKEKGKGPLRDLIYEPSRTSLQEELKIKNTPLS